MALFSEMMDEQSNLSDENRRLRAALEKIRVYAKKLRKSSELMGPREYQDDPKAMRVWQRSLYHEGKTLEGMVKAALRGSKIFEPDNDAHSEAFVINH